ncbi:unnamed protein product [Lampetra fluviatilis]
MDFQLLHAGAERGLGKAVIAWCSSLLQRKATRVMQVSPVLRERELEEESAPSGLWSVFGQLFHLVRFVTDRVSEPCTAAGSPRCPLAAPSGDARVCGALCQAAAAATLYVRTHSLEAETNQRRPGAGSAAAAFRADVAKAAPRDGHAHRTVTAKNRKYGEAGSSDPGETPIQQWIDRRTVVALRFSASSTGMRPFHHRLRAARGDKRPAAARDHRVGIGKGRGAEKCPNTEKGDDEFGRRGTRLCGRARQPTAGEPPPDP